MKLSRSTLLFIASLVLLVSIPEGFLLPIRNSTLLAFCGRAKPQEEMEELRVWALEEENASLRAEVKQLKSALAMQEGDDLRHSLSSALPAKVVYRGPSTWNSSLWVGVGEIDNRGLTEPAIGKGSPVVLGRALVGVVDYVGKRRSKVTLVTDSHFHPAVEAVRGDLAYHSLLPHLELIEEAISRGGGDEDLQKNLSGLKNHLGKFGPDTVHLAKGELNGAARFLWRSRLKVLSGVGFEGEGCAEVGDLLMTTGLDGVFPAGLEVAHVVEVSKPHRASPSYELKALPAAGELERAQVLFILPPQR